MHLRILASHPVSYTHLYDFYINDNRLYFVIGDVSGKGIPASLFMAITRSLFRTLSQQAVSPARIVTEMNNSISDNNESNMFVTLIVGILDLQTGILKLSNAGHNPPFIIYPDGEVSLLEFKTYLFAGVMEDVVYSDEEITLKEGSKLFLYTDGVTEAEDCLLYTSPQCTVNAEPDRYHTYPFDHQRKSQYIQQSGQQ